MQATPWNRKVLLSSFEQSSPSLLLPALVLVFDLALFGAGTALVLLASSLALKLAGMLVGLRFGPMAHTLYAASTPALHRAPVGDLLHWELMRWARDAGGLELDLGSSCTDIPPTETHPNYGIYRFKYELGARLTLCTTYHDHVFTPVRYRLARHLERHALRPGLRLVERLRWPSRARGAAAAAESTPVRTAS